MLWLRSSCKGLRKHTATPARLSFSTLDYAILLEWNALGDHWVKVSLSWYIAGQGVSPACRVAWKAGWKTFPGVTVGV